MSQDRKDATGRWSVFTEAAEDLLTAALALRGKSKYTAHALATISLAIQTGSRFYLPFSEHVLDVNEASADLLWMGRLPYDQVAVLYDSHIDGVATPGITIAFEPRGEFALRANLFDQADPQLRAAENERLIGLMGAVRLTPSQQKDLGIRWFAFIGVGLARVIKGEGIPGIVLGINPWVPGYSSKELGEVLADDALVATNLCALLSLTNVTPQERTAPVALNKKRARKGRRELLSYHVLHIDSKPHGPHSGLDASGRGVRSHLRRGHLRRLSGSERMTWVRPTFVNGSSSGFVRKDYDLTKAVVGLRKKPEGKKEEAK